MCQKIVSGGQTGVDRGVLDACLKNNFLTGGWCPKGKLAEEGIIDSKYPLKETIESEYISRTRKNANDTDATFIISDKELYGGTLLTLKIVNELKKPVLVVIIREQTQKEINDQIQKWLNLNFVFNLKCCRAT